MPQQLSAAHGSCALCCRSREIAPAKGEPKRKAAFMPACAVMQAVPRFAFIALFREFILSNAASARVYVRAGLSLSSSPRGPVVVTFARKNPRVVARARRKILSTESKHACARYKLSLRVRWQNVFAYMQTVQTVQTAGWTIKWFDV